MRVRKVPIAAVEAVLGNPEFRRNAEPSQDGKPAEILFGTFGGRRLKVYIEIGRVPVYVKTTCWIRSR